MKRTTGHSSVTDRLADLSEPVRLRILRILEREELSVGEVARIAQLPQSTVSRHLKILAEGDWISKRAEGTATLYRMVSDDLAPAARDLWVTVREQLGPSPELEEDIRRLAAVLAERRSDSHAFFGRVAGDWDSVRGELFGDRFTLEALLTMADPSWRVADLGCGTGNASELLAPHVAHIDAVDRSRPMLTAARKRLRAFDNVTFREGELEDLPLDDDSVDLSVCVLVLHHVDDPAALCREMARVTRPGGLALVVDMLEHDRSSYRHTMGHRWLGFSEQKMTELMNAAGVTDVVVRPLVSSPAGLGPGLFVCRARVDAPGDAA